MKYKILLENFKEFIKEAVYSPEMEKFIKFAHETEKEYPKHVIENSYKINKYASANFKFLGMGVHKNVYITSDGEVIKIVKRDAFSGIDPSIKSMKKEIEVFNRHDLHDVFPRIFERSKNFLWYVTEEMTPFNKIPESEQKELVKKWFPKLYELNEYGFELPSSKIYSNSGTATFYPYHVMDIATTIANHNTGSSRAPARKQIVSKIINFIAPQTRGSRVGRVQSTVDKELIRRVIEYINNPDTMVKTLSHILKAANIVGIDLDKLDDMHTGNLAIDDKGNFKIIDI